MTDPLALEADLSSSLMTVNLGPSHPAMHGTVRLTVTLDTGDYTLLAGRYGLAPDDRLGIKEAATRELIAFVEQVPAAPSQAALPGKPAKGGNIKTTEQPPPPRKGKGKSGP